MRFLLLPLGKQAVLFNNKINERIESFWGSRIKGVPCPLKLINTGDE